MSPVTSSPVSSSFGTQASVGGADALHTLDRPAGAGDVAGRAWFQDWNEGSAAGLHADVEVQAKGLSASEHAERVLSHLIESR